jgi:hypothetical protein
MNVKLLTKDFFKKRGGEQLDELDDKTKVVSFIKLPKSVNDYMGDKGQPKYFNFSSVDDDIFDDKSGSSGNFEFSFNQPKGIKAMDEFYDEMLPSIDYSGELPEYYEYKFNKMKTTNDRIVDKLRENAIDEDETRLPDVENLHPEIKLGKGEALERFKAQVAKYNAENRPKNEEILTTQSLPSSLTTGKLQSRREMGINNRGGEETKNSGDGEIVVKPVKKYRKETAEERQHKLRGEKLAKIDNELKDIGEGKRKLPDKKEKPKVSESNFFQIGGDDVEEGKETPKKSPEEIRQSYLDSRKKEYIEKMQKTIDTAQNDAKAKEDAEAAEERARKIFNNILDSAGDLREEIEKVKRETPEKEFKALKATEMQMKVYNS